MKKQVFRIESDGFNGVWYPCSVSSKRGMIVMLGDSAEDRMASSAAKWLNKQGLHVMAMSPDRKDYGHHNYPLERFGTAIRYMKAKGCEQLGVVGASTTGMMALLAASYYPEFSLCIAISPPDFVMEGFYQDGKDGMHERPGDNESTVTWQGKPLPYLPYAYRHPDIGSGSGPTQRPAATKSPPGRCLTNRSAGIPSGKRNGSKWRTFAGSSFLSARRTMYSGIPAGISGGWSSA